MNKIDYTYPHKRRGYPRAMLRSRAQLKGALVTAAFVVAFWASVVWLALG